jgi:hypothetical protein
VVYSTLLFVSYSLFNLVILDNFIISTVLYFLWLFRLNTGILSYYKLYQITLKILITGIAIKKPLSAHTARITIVILISLVLLVRVKLFTVLALFLLLIIARMPQSATIKCKYIQINLFN